MESELVRKLSVQLGYEGREAEMVAELRSLLAAKPAVVHHEQAAQITEHPQLRAQAHHVEGKKGK